MEITCKVCGEAANTVPYSMAGEYHKYGPLAHDFQPKYPPYYMEEYISICPACGNPIDYCQGHGEYGDPNGNDILNMHDNDDHSECHENSDCSPYYIEPVKNEED